MRKSPRAFIVIPTSFITPHIFRFAQPDARQTLDSYSRLPEARPEQIVGAEMSLVAAPIVAAVAVLVTVVSAAPVVAAVTVVAVVVAAAMVVAAVAAAATVLAEIVAASAVRVVDVAH
mmetsp:Transcript_25065/g.58776  ORF Transcript_25065/g.58776 Transcript_25065/m.58776 type:complete len:118 (-) Transcript_25065:1913-2266(-)